MKYGKSRDEPSIFFYIWTKNGRPVSLHVCLIFRQEELAEDTIYFLHKSGRLNRAAHLLSFAPSWTNQNSALVLTSRPIGLEQQLNASQKLNAVHSDQREKEFWSREGAIFSSFFLFLK
jgi:hypothetical protein